MKAAYKQDLHSETECITELGCPALEEDIKKTRIALDTAYAGFDYVIDEELIDSYIYQINSLQKRYNHLLMLANSDLSCSSDLDKHTSIGTLVRHVFH